MATTRSTTARSLIKGSIKFIRGDDTITSAAERLSRENIGALPVCSDSGQLMGMITDRDIAVGVVAKGKDPAKTHVREVAHLHAITIDAEAPLEDAMQLMAEHKVRRLCVVDGNSCIGLISQADIARAMPAEETGRLVGLISRD